MDCFRYVLFARKPLPEGEIMLDILQPDIFQKPQKKLLEKTKNFIFVRPVANIL